MSDGKRSAAAASRAAATADLFKILKAMACDPDVRDADFRIAFRIAQTVDARTDWGVVGDELLSDEVPRCDHAKLRRFRRHMEDLGWLQTKPGRRGHATEYLLLEDRAESILERCARAKERRETEFHLRHLENRVSRQARTLGVKITPLNQTVDESYGGKIAPDKESVDPPLLPQKSTYGFSTGTVQDMALGEDSHPLPCIWCGQPSIGLNGSGKPGCRSHLPRAIVEALAYRAATDGE